MFGLDDTLCLGVHSSVFGLMCELRTGQVHRALCYENNSLFPFFFTEKQKHPVKISVVQCF